MFYPIIYRRKDGTVDVLAARTKRAAVGRKRMLERNPDVEVARILPTGNYRYSDFICMDPRKEE